MIQPEFLRDEDVQIDVAGASVAGRLTIPCQPRGIVAFAHGSGSSRQVLDLNRAAAAAMRAPCEIAIVEGATHLFEEPGALEQVASLARRWFLHHLTPITVQP
jgi:hypothetical protein